VDRVQAKEGRGWENTSICHCRVLLLTNAIACVSPHWRALPQYMWMLEKGREERSGHKGASSRQLCVGWQG